MSVCLHRRTLLAATLGMAGLSVVPSSALAQLRIEITGVGANQIPIVLQPLFGSTLAQFDLMRIVAADLSRTGDFRLIDTDREPTFEQTFKPDLSIWRAREATVLASGTMEQLADGRWEVRYRLFDVVQGTVVDEWVATSALSQIRMLAHRIADRIYQKMTGYGALFCSRLAYVVQHSKTSYELIVAESDGANAQPALKSSEPIISPTWSPDGKLLAYVSFEAKKPVVYVHEIATGKRKVLANFKGNNSAPAFSPDGKYLAVALSRDGSTQIFLIHTDGSGVKRFSRSFGIDTEPVFSPDGKYLYFTSDRGGRPQIYRQALDSDVAQRVTFNGDYAVSPSLNPEGTHLCYVTRLNGEFRIAIMEIATGQEMILTNNQYDENPSFSPNGRIIVYASERNKKGVLGTVSVDGAVSSWLTAASGDIREPTWGPLLG